MICKNRDHVELGLHEVDGQPIEQPCGYDSEYAWSYATNRDSVFTKALRADHVRHFGSADAIRIEYEINKRRK
jgi:hypothetical protein